MELSPSTAEAYLRYAFGSMLEVAEELYQHLGHMEFTADVVLS